MNTWRTKKPYYPPEKNRREDRCPKNSTVGRPPRGDGPKSNCAIRWLQDAPKQHDQSHYQHNNHKSNNDNDDDDDDDDDDNNNNNNNNTTAEHSGRHSGQHQQPLGHRRCAKPYNIGILATVVCLTQLLMWSFKSSECCRATRELVANGSACCGVQLVSPLWLICSILSSSRSCWWTRKLKLWDGGE